MWLIAILVGGVLFSPLSDGKSCKSFEISVEVAAVPVSYALADLLGLELGMLLEKCAGFIESQSVAPSPETPGPEETPTSDERIKEILLKFYEDTGGPSWEDQPNWIEDSTLPLPLWDGESPLSETRFAVLDAQGHIVSLMPELVQLELEKNNLTGNVPVSFAGFPHLLELRLRDNRLSGVIPQEIVDSPYFDDWRMERQQEGYGLTLPTSDSGDSAEAVYDSQPARHPKVERPAGELKSEYLRGIAVECGGEKFL